MLNLISNLLQRNNSHTSLKKPTEQPINNNISNNTHNFSSINLNKGLSRTASHFSKSLMNSTSSSSLLSGARKSFSKVSKSSKLKLNNEVTATSTAKGCVTETATTSGKRLSLDDNSSFALGYSSKNSGLLFVPPGAKAVSDDLDLHETSYLSSSRDENASFSNDSVICTSRKEIISNLNSSHFESPNYGSYQHNTSANYGKLNEQSPVKSEPVVLPIKTKVKGVTQPVKKMTYQNVPVNCANEISQPLSLSRLYCKSSDDFDAGCSNVAFDNVTYSYIESLREKSKQHLSAVNLLSIGSRTSNRQPMSRKSIGTFHSNANLTDSTNVAASFENRNYMKLSTVARASTASNSNLDEDLKPDLKPSDNLRAIAHLSNSVSFLRDKFESNSTKASSSSSSSSSSHLSQNQWSSPLASPQSSNLSSPNKRSQNAFAYAESKALNESVEHTEFLLSGSEKIHSLIERCNEDFQMETAITRHVRRCVAARPIKAPLKERLVFVRLFGDAEVAYKFTIDFAIGIFF